MPDPGQDSGTHEISWLRRVADHLATGFAAVAAVLVIVPLLAIFAYLVIKGVGSINIAFLTQTPKPPGELGGGMANAIVGTGIILAVASVIGVPLGIGSGIYLAEYGRNRFGDLVRFTADVLNGVPSIVIGIAVYSLVVVPQKHFSALSGGIALGIMMIPTVARATRRDAADGAERDTRSRLWAGHSQVAYDSLHLAAHGFRGGDHRLHAGLRPGGGRNGSLAVYRVWKPVLELEIESAYCGSVVAGFYLRHFAL